MDSSHKPWWVDDPDLAAIRRGVLEEIESAETRPDIGDQPDPVLNEILSRATWRELADARDDLSRARSRYADAVRAARVCGLSWGEIGRVLGVSKQQLHRKFRRQV